MNEPTHDTVTDPRAGTLTDEQRNRFLRARGVVPGADPQRVAEVLEEWPDDQILEAIKVGLG